MSLVPQEQLNANYWAHHCGAKDGSVTYTPNGQSCFLCNKTEEQAAADNELLDRPE